jgi:hypothetical protein
MAPFQLDDLKSEAATLTSERDRWSNSFWVGLGKMRRRVESLRRTADTVSNAGQLPSVTHNVERDFDAFKAQQCQQYDALSTSEAGMEEILAVLAQRYEGWMSEPSALYRPATALQDADGGGRLQWGGSSGSRSRGPSTERQSARTAVQSEDSEITEIRTALETLESEIERAGGATGGWSEVNHEAFMRLFRTFKMQASPQFFTRAQERFPHQPETYVADHVRWYAEYEQFQATKQRLLDRWRERRRELKREALEAEGELAAEEAAQMKQASEREQRQRVETKQRLTEWRLRRAEEEELAIEKQRRFEEDQARMECEKRRQQLQQRESVEAFSREREISRLRAREAELQASAVAQAARRDHSQDTKHRIARRNQEVLRKMQASTVREGPLSSARSRTGSEPPGTSRSRGHRSLYDHVESRLYDPTTSFTQKARMDQAAAQDIEGLMGATTEPVWKNRLRGHKQSERRPEVSMPPTAEKSLLARAKVHAENIVGGSLTPRMRSM